MNEELVTKLVTMAETLGTTVEHLWSVLIKQAFISGILHSFHIVLWLLPTIYIGLKVYKNTCVKKDKCGDYLWRDDQAMFAWAGFATLLLIVFCLVPYSISNMITALINPEYWALKEILR